MSVFSILNPAVLAQLSQVPREVYDIARDWPDHAREYRQATAKVRDQMLWLDGELSAGRAVRKDVADAIREANYKLTESAETFNRIQTIIAQAGAYAVNQGMLTPAQVNAYMGGGDELSGLGALPAVIVGAIALCIVLIGAAVAVKIYVPPLLESLAYVRNSAAVTDANIRATAAVNTENMKRVSAGQSPLPPPALVQPPTPPPPGSAFGTIFGGVGSLALIGAALFLLWPMVAPLLSRRRSS